MKEEIKTAERELNKRERNNLPDAEFKTLVVRMPEELSEDLSSIKKIQSEMKDSLIETKSDLQGNNSRVDEAENQMIWNIRKQKTNTATRRKNNPIK